MSTGPVEHYPLFHVRPPTGWVNDPNGPAHAPDGYHLFCQHNASGSVHGDIGWAHFTSNDLVRWRQLRPGLLPRPGGPDRDGCWSGSALVDGRDLDLVYSGFRFDEPYQSVCVARWEARTGRIRYDGAPVITGPPPEVGVDVFRDPFVWRENAGVAALVGARLRDGGGAALLYRGPHPRSWSYAGVACSGADPLLAAYGPGVAWECPQLVRFETSALLVASAWRRGIPDHVFFVTGRWSGSSLDPARVGRLDLGPDFYAPALTVDRTGRCLLWGWSWEARPPARAAAAGWAGVLTLPRVVTLDADGRPAMAPAPELTALRGPARPFAVEVPADDEVLLEPDAGDAVEVEARIVATAGRCWLRLRRAPGAVEYVEVGVDADAGEVYLSRDDASLDPEVRRGTFRAPVAPGPHRLRVFVDRSIVEVYVDDGQTLTARCYPTRSDSVGLAVGARGPGGSVTVTRWQIEQPALIA